MGNSVLKGAISDVRTVLADDPQDSRFIETVPRRGYRFIAAVTPVPPMRAHAGSGEFTPPQMQLPEQSSASARAWALERPAGAFVGRAKELTSLGRAWDQVTSGRRVMFWIAGEPGIGKTTLMEHFVAGLGKVACARGRCVQHYGSSEPYHPVLEALADLCRNDDSMPALLRAIAPTWLLQLPWLSSAEQRETLLRELVGVNLERMLREMGELLSRYTERQPLLVVTEDLHWADKPTIQLMDYLARRRIGGSLMWLSSFRLSEVIASGHPLNTLRHELRLHGQWYDTPLSGLLTDVFGLRTNEFYNAGVVVTNVGEEEVKGDIGFYEVLEPSTAEVMARFSNVEGNTPSITVNKFGKGQAIYVATPAQPQIMRPLYRQLYARLGLEPGPKTPDNVYARFVDGRVLYVNPTSESKDITIDGTMSGVLTGKRWAGTLRLEPFGVDLLQK